MEIVYGGRNLKSLHTEKDSEPVLHLIWNNWDDYGFKTTLKAFLISKGRALELDNLKILLKGYTNTAAHFESLVTNGWTGIFPPPNVEYISNPTAITFYEQILAELGLESALSLAEALRDAGYLARMQEEEGALALLQEEGFRTSLQRERGDQKAFLDGWKLLSQQLFSIENFTFRFRDPKGVIQALPLSFTSTSILPHDINVLIGPNGSGKSECICQLVSHWLTPKKSDEGIGFQHPPNLSQIVAISYSPFEQRLPVDATGLQLADTDVYRYFGLRGREKPTKRNEPQSRVTLSLDHPRKDAARSLITCVSDDQRYSALPDWAKKVRTLHRVLQTAFDFDFAAVEIPTTLAAAALQALPSTGDQITMEILTSDSSGNARRQNFVRIDELTSSSLNVQALATHTIMSSGVSLFKDGKPIELSSGQRLFTYIVINLLGSIRRNSLVVIDEPELFLHPTLEISLISMLKSIIESFACKALIATHSLILAREVPRDCVHVFEPTDGGLIIKHPPFQTFGGDVQRISTYVFGDRSTSKPFEQWIASRVSDFGSRKALLDRLGDELNEELIIELSDQPATKT